MPAADDKQTKVLRNLTVRKAGFVKRGANQHAFVGLLKDAADGDGDAPATVDEIMQENEFWDLWWQLRSALEQSVREIMDSDGTDQAALLQDAVTQFVDRLLAVKIPKADVALVVKASMEKLAGPLVAFLENKAPWKLEDLQKTLGLCETEARMPARQVKENAMSKEALLKLLGDEKATLTAEQRAQLLKFLAEDATALTSALKKAEDAQAGAKKAVDELAAVTVKVVELEKAAGDVKCPKCGAMVPMAKAAPQSAKEQELQKRLDDLEDKNLHQECTTLVKDLGLPDVDKVVEVMKTITKRAPEKVDALKEILRGASATKAELAKLSKGLGRADNDPSADADPRNKVTALVKAAMSKDPKLDAVSAEAKVYKDNPELQEQIREEENQRAKEGKPNA